MFAIGLGNDIDKDSLRKMANDPAGSSFDPLQPEGLAVFACAAGASTVSVRS